VAELANCCGRCPTSRLVFHRAQATQVDHAPLEIAQRLKGRMEITSPPVSTISMSSIERHDWPLVRNLTTPNGSPRATRLSLAAGGLPFSSWKNAAPLRLRPTRQGSDHALPRRPPIWDAQRAHPLAAPPPIAQGSRRLGPPQAPMRSTCGRRPAPRDSGLDRRELPVADFARHLHTRPTFARVGEQELVKASLMMPCLAQLRAQSSPHRLRRRKRGEHARTRSK